MKAARFHARGDIRIEDIPEPTVAPGTVGIDVAWCGICGTDLHIYLWDEWAQRTVPVPMITGLPLSSG